MAHPSFRSALPFFLPAAPGERFCLYHAPDPAQRRRGAILYVHPFAEELNKTRRMAALQARAFAAAGHPVLQMDLYGCGDSSGDFADARWDIWCRDLMLACQWLRGRGGERLYLWGLRLGALLAIDFACAPGCRPDALILWQPVVSGRTHLNQFLRMEQAARLLTLARTDAGTNVEAPELVGADTANQAAPAGAAIHVATGRQWRQPQPLRQPMLPIQAMPPMRPSPSTTAPAYTAIAPAGNASAPAQPAGAIEVAGYTLSDTLAQAIGQRDAAFVTPHYPVHWLESATPAASATTGHAALETQLPPASQRHIAHWRREGVPLQVQPLCGQAFWASTENVTCHALLAATAALELP